MAMTQTADVIVVGGGVQGASLAFHLARRGTRVIVLERGSVGGGATGRSSGFVRMHYDYEPDARLAWASFPYFSDWANVVGAGDCSFVNCGFVQVIPTAQEAALHANVAMLQGIGVDTLLIDRAEFERLVPGVDAHDITTVAWEPRSGFADPSGTAAGFMAAARAKGATLVQQCRVEAVTVEGGRVSGVTTDRGTFSAPIVVDAAGAWAGQVAATVGLEVPIRPWRHDTAYFGLPDGHAANFPIVLDNVNEVYFRPEGRDLMLVGLEIGNDVGGSPDRPMGNISQGIIDLMVARLMVRVPWMGTGTFRTAHGGQDGLSPDERPILGPEGPDGFWLACGFSGTGFKTAPAMGASLSEWILDGRPSTVDITPYRLDRFAAGRTLLGEHPYGALWR